MEVIYRGHIRIYEIQGLGFPKLTGAILGSPIRRMQVCGAL